MHHITDLQAAQRELNERERDTTMPLHRERTPACTANACGGDSKRCPCPTACELPADGLQARILNRFCDLLDRVPLQAFWLAYGFAIGAIVIGACVAARWPS